MNGSFFKIAASLLVSCAFPLIGSYLAYWRFQPWFLGHTWVTEPSHGVLESFGACSSLIVAAFLLLLGRNSRTKSHYVWLSCGMLFMGILDLFHSGLSLTMTSGWLRSVAILGSGFLFLLIWLPDRYAVSSLCSHLPLAAVVSALLVALLSLALPSYVPSMVKGNEFTFISRAMNSLGGVFCLISGLNLAFRYRVTGTTGDLVMFNFLLLLGSSELAFPIAIRYGLIWWFFHVIKVSAYVVVLFYVFFVYQRGERLLQESRDELERRVNERTAELSESEKRFRLLYENTPVPYVSIDEVGRIVEVNRKWVETFLYSKEEAIGTNFVNYLAPGYSDVFLDRFSSLKATCEHWGQEYEMAKKDGALCTVVLDGNVLRDEKGRFERAYYALHDITDRKLAEKAVEQGRELLRVVINSLPVGIFYVDSERLFLFNNKTHNRWWARPVDSDLAGCTVEEVWGGDWYPEIKKRVESAMCGQELSYEETVNYSDGVTRDVSAVFIPHVGHDGEVLGVVGLITDISESKRQKKALDEIRRYYKSILSSAWEGIFGLDKLGNHTFVNPSAARMLGYTVEELIGKHSHSTWHHSRPDGNPYPEEDCPIYATLRGETVHHVRGEVFWRKDGTSFLAECMSAPILKHGERIGAVVSFMDVTESNRAEEALRESEQRSRLLIEESPIGIVISQNGKFVYVNPAFVEIFGYDGTDEALGLSSTDLVAPEERELITKRRTDQLEGKSVPLNYEVRGLRKDGKVFDLALWPRVINYLGEPAILTFCADRSEPKSLRTQLFQAQKMEAVGTLASGIAHDFNNLLQIVLGYSEFMLQRKKEGEKDYADLQKIIQAGNRGTELAKGLLTFSRKVDLVRAPVDLNEEILHVKNLLSRTIPKTIKIELHLSVDLETIHADSSQINQILINLGVNARDAMTDGGTVSFETANMELDEEYCRTHFSTTPGRYVLLAVSDTGHGMDKETLAHIFEPFFTTKEKGKGTGLGLATVYGIVKQHAGHITCYSEPGYGTTFKIYFPANPTEKQSETQTTEIAVRGGTETLLVVDDDDAITDLVSKSLNSLGYEVIVAGNGKDALEIYQREGDRISLVILDLIMPEMDGRQCLHEILLINPKAKVLIASGHSLNGQAKGILALGVKGFAEKPYNMTKLLHMVREILDKD